MYHARTVNGRRTYEHRLVLEEHLGRELERIEYVHHVNGDTSDNSIENLRIVTRSEHTKLHPKKPTVCICSECQQETINHARGLCHRCYDRLWARDAYQGNIEEARRKGRERWRANHPGLRLRKT